MIKWHLYPEEQPVECMGGEHGYTLLLKDGSIYMRCFYDLSDAAHDHSPWQQAIGWLSSDEIEELLKSVPISNRKWQPRPMVKSNLINKEYYWTCNKCKVKLEDSNAIRKHIQECYPSEV